MWGKALVSLMSWAQSDIGRKRLQNEDAFYQDLDLGLFIVADGMGGHKGGGQASKIATQVAASVFKEKRLAGAPIQEALQHAFFESAQAVYLKGQSDADLCGMGTTLSALATDGEQAFIAHIGDSRIYCFREKTLHQLTSDHSLVNEQVHLGLMSQEEARISSLRNIITRAIGHQKNPCPDLFSTSLKNNDTFLLCTDGLNNMIVDSDISQIITYQESTKIVKELVREANDRGGDDNITVILIKVSA